MSKDKITITARYGIKHKLERVEGNTFKFINGSNFGMLRCSADPHNMDKLISIDPEGGPMFIVGGKVCGISSLPIVKSIDFKNGNYLITFENDLPCK